ncbi:phosphotransferase [Saccharothrix deserti]|uniref:phosphotransferase n=1 Tax=Saccharothrix deserti TaxID=2593674 RepID=UPI00131AB97D|nr:phosphotransferase [Saccharothrix deserti]
MVDSLTKRRLSAPELDVLVRRALGVPLVLADGRIEGIIDPERALFGDPLAEIATVALFTELDDDFTAGYGRQAFTGSEQTRIALYRTYPCLVMIVEGVPRGYSGEERDGHVRFFRDRLAEYLEL